MQRNLDRLRLREHLLDRRGQQIVDQLPSGVPDPARRRSNWAMSDMTGTPIPSAIRHHHRHGQPVRQRHIDVVGIREPDREFATGDEVANDRIAVDHLDVVGFEPPEPSSGGPFITKLGVPSRHVEGRRPEARICNRHLSFPFGVGRIGKSSTGT